MVHVRERDQHSFSLQQSEESNQSEFEESWACPGEGGSEHRTERRVAKTANMTGNRIQGLHN